MFEIAHSHRLKVDQALLVTLFTQHATRSNRSFRCTRWSDFRRHLQQISPKLSQFKLGLGPGYDMAPMPTWQGKGDR